MSARLGIRVAAFVLAGAGYVLACHWLMTRWGDSPWSVLGVIAPMLAAVAAGFWRSGQRALAALATVPVLALCGQAMLGTRLPTQWLYLAQHAGVNLALALGFGGTLRAGHTPLITALARRVHRRFTPDMAVYTRHCTVAWTLYFLAVVVLSLALYARADFDTWAVFANLVSPVSVALMFGGEYLLRYRLHPEFERASVADAVRSYLQGRAE